MLQPLLVVFVGLRAQVPRVLRARPHVEDMTVLVVPTKFVGPLLCMMMMMMMMMVVVMSHEVEWA